MRITAVTGLAVWIVCVAVGIGLLESGAYGLTLFVLIPAALGGAVSRLAKPATAGKAALWGAATIMFPCAFLALAGRDGLVCIAMAIPLAMPLGALGGWIAFYTSHVTPDKRSTLSLLALPLASLTWDLNAPPPIYAVTSNVVVNASPQQVWKHVITFPDLPTEREWVFHTGLAYPIRARIEGTGDHAIRYCEFSTGPFVEPITVWAEPHLLRFRVTDNPAPLNEWSLWGPIHPKHLHGYLVSRQGQFKLTALPNGKTLLEGTTWYSHGLWPSQYWRLWSDAIIHRIHLRVLNHVRVLAEQEAHRNG